MAVRWQIPSRIKPSPGQSQPIQLKDGLAVDANGRPRGTPEVVWLWRGVVFGPFLLGTVVVATMVATSLYRLEKARVKLVMQNCAWWCWRSLE